MKVPDRRCAGTASHFSPQNRLSLLTKTIDLFSPISDRAKGWRTQLAGEIVSPSTTVTCSPPGWPWATSDYKLFGIGGRRIGGLREGGCSAFCNTCLFRYLF